VFLPYETVIGLEVHVELATQSKLFCGCPNRFGAEANTLVCPICLGLPGVLPTLNERAVELHLQAALALGCEILPVSKFDRKNYFYPDIPKNWQTSQYDLPLARHGRVPVGVAEAIALTRIHLEEDTGKSIHFRQINGKLVPDRLASSEFSLVDYNRAGVPLLEIVSEPDMRTPEQASAYLQSLRDILVWLGISDCKMEEGSMRCDANISIRPVGQTELGVKAEIKNMNSFRSVRLALEFEIARQTEMAERGGTIVQETRGWDEGKGVTISMRSKEDAHDYRYFPEPDLPILETSVERQEQVRAALPELPEARARRYAEHHGLSSYDAQAMVSSRLNSDFFEATCALGAEPKEVANWLSNEIARLLQEKGGLSISETQLSPEGLFQVIELVKKAAISHKSARELLARLVAEGGQAQRLVEQMGLAQMSNNGELHALVNAVIAENPIPVAEFQAGKAKALNSLVGQVMKRSKGKANPAQVQAMLSEVLLVQ
jgi:aspartyl-tRNA(Asn)/glutamyl-tRNA(Gln) amidotransferase subunit B